MADNSVDPSKIHEVPLDAIVVENRDREEYGDIEGLAVSLSMYGLIAPIVIDESNRLVAGERRLKAATRLKWPTIKAIYFNDLDEVQKKEIELEENVRRKSLTWQEELAAKESLLALKQRIYGTTKQGQRTDLNPNGKGFGVSDLASFIGESAANTSRDLKLARAIKQHPEIGESKDKATAWKRLNRLKEQAIQEELARRAQAVSTSNILHHVDALSWLGSLEDKSVDLVLTDPPYGKDLELKSKDILQPYEDKPEDIMSLLGECFKHFYRVLKDDRVLLVFFDMPHYNWVIDLVEDAGFYACYFPFIWVKRHQTGAMPNETLYAMGYECVLHCMKGSRSINSPGLPNWKEVQPVPVAKRSHPVEKPPLLLKYFIEQHSLPGELVIDPFAGSASTLISALETNRLAQGSEIDARYYNVGILNIQAFNKRKELLATAEPVERPHYEVEPLPDTFEGLTPGTPTWMRYWRERPDEQEAMIAYSRALTEEIV